MTTALHTALALGEVHQVHQWEYANQTAREAATGFVEADKFKWALQMDNDTFWVLTNHSPITWVQVNPTDPENVNTLKIACIKATPGTLAIGTPVCLVGFDPLTPIAYVEAASANTAGLRPALGLLEDEITDSVAGHVVYIGPVAGPDTSTLAVGDLLYLGNTPGTYTVNTPPTGETSKIQNVGVVLYVGNPGVIAATAQGFQDLPNLNNGKVWVGGVSNGQPSSRNWAHDHTTTAEGGELPAASKAVPQNNVFYVGKHGNDGNNGRAPETAFLTIQAAIAAAVSAGPGPGGGYRIAVLDSGVYTGAISIPEYVIIDAPATYMIGSITLADNASALVAGLVATGSDAVTKSSGTGTASIQLGFVSLGLATNGFVCTAGTLAINVDQMIVQNGTGIGSSSSGRISLDALGITVSGSGSAISNTSTGSIIGKVGAIDAVSGTGIVCGANGQIDLVVQHLVANVAYNVTSGGQLRMVAVHFSGTRTGFANLTVAGLPEVSTLVTTELDTNKRLSPNGSGGVSWVTGLVPETKVLYVGKHGSDSNDGSVIARAFLTITAAIAAAVAKGLSYGNSYSIVVMDSGVYSESFEIPTYCNVFAPSADIHGLITVNDRSGITAREIDPSSGNVIQKTSGTGTAYVNAWRIESLGSADCILCSSGNIEVRADTIEVTDGIAVGGNSAGDILLDVLTINVLGTGKAISNTSTGNVYGTVNQISAPSGTAISIGATAKANLWVGNLNASVAYNVTTGGVLKAFVSSLVGTQTGVASITVAGTELRVDGTRPMAAALNMADYAINNVKSMAFDLDASVPHATGTMHWNQADGTAEIDTDVADTTIQVGQETVVRGLNSTGGTISNGEVVYVSGAASSRPAFSKAVASSDDVYKTIGIATHEILNGAQGFATRFGLVRNLNTSAFSAGDVLYVSPTTPGAMTATKPSAPNRVVRVGIVITVDASNGIILAAASNISQLAAELRTTETDTTKRLAPDGSGGVAFVTSSATGTVVQAKKASAGTISKGQPVYATGYAGGYITVELARADSSSTMPAIGLANETITDSVAGGVMVLGTVSNINTSAWSVGNALWVDPSTAGQLTNSRPSGTALVQKIGQVTSSDVSTGSILVIGAGRTNDVPNLAQYYFWMGNASGVATATKINDLVSKATPVGADIVHIEDSDASYAAKKATLTSIAALATPIFGSQFQEASSEAESQTTSDAFQQKLRLTTPVVPAGKYRIGYQYTWWSSSSTQDFKGRVQLDDTTDLFNHQEEASDTGSDQLHSVAGFKYYTLSNAAHTIDLDYCGTLSGSTYAISQARLEIWRVE